MGSVQDMTIDDEISSQSSFPNGRLNLNSILSLTEEVPTDEEF